MLATLRAVLERSEKSYPDDLGQIRATWQPVDGATLPAEATGRELHKWASQIEEGVFDILDDLGGIEGEAAMRESRSIQRRIRNARFPAQTRHYHREGPRGRRQLKRQALALLRNYDGTGKGGWRTLKSALSPFLEENSVPPQRPRFGRLASVPLSFSVPLPASPAKSLKEWAVFQTGTLGDAGDAIFPTTKRGKPKKTHEAENGMRTARA